LLGFSDDSHGSTHRAVQYVHRWWIGDVLSIEGESALSGHNTENLTVDLNECRVWRVSRLLHVKDTERTATKG
jgi:hypothetical protein